MITIIAAISQNGHIWPSNELVLGYQAHTEKSNKKTKRRSVIIGRKTFEETSVIFRETTNIILSRNKNFHVKNFVVAKDIPEAMKKARVHEKEGEVFIRGGLEIYKSFMSVADKICLTVIYKNLDSGHLFPKIDPRRWQLVEEKHFAKDQKNLSDYSFFEYKRIR